MGNGRVLDMRTNFDTVEETQRLYFDMQLELLNEIFTSDSESWIWDHRDREEQTKIINEMLDKIMEQMIEMQLQEMNIMLSEAEETVKHYENAMESYVSEAERYAMKAFIEVEALKEAFISIKNEASMLGDRLKYWIENGKEEAKHFLEKEAARMIIGMVQEVFGFGLFGTRRMKKAFDDIEDLAADLCSMAIDLISSCQTLIEIQDIIKDIEGEDGIFQLADLKDNTKDVLQLAIQMKGVGLVFTDVKNIVNSYLDLLQDDIHHEIQGTTELMVSLDKVCDRGSLMIEEASDFSDYMFQFIEKVDSIRATVKDVYDAKLQVQKIKREIKELERQQERTRKDVDKSREEYEAKMDELEAGYENATKQDMERFQEEITERYNNFTSTFDTMQASYNDQLSNLAISLQEKMFGLKDASMNQRSMIMPIFLSSCDNLYYTAFYTCDQKDIPLMSENFTELLTDLDSIQLTYDFAFAKLGENKPTMFGEGPQADGPYPFEITDGLLPRPDGNSTRKNPISSMRESGTMTISLKEYDIWREFDEFWRVRIDMVRLIMYQKDGTPIPSPSDIGEENIRIKVEFPTTFNDTNEDEQSEMFSATKYSCTPTYYTQKECETNPNQVCFVDSCEIADEFSETNYQVSMDGIFRFTVINYDDLEMELLDNARIEFSGTRIELFRSNE